MARISIAASAATTDGAKPLSMLLGISGVTLVDEALLQFRDATVAVGADVNSQPVQMAAGQEIGYQKPIDISLLYVRSNAAGVPGTIALLGWQDA